MQAIAASTVRLALSNAHRFNRDRLVAMDDGKKSFLSFFELRTFGQPHKGVRALLGQKGSDPFMWVRGGGYDNFGHVSLRR
jgi:hypothetical protein